MNAETTRSGDSAAAANREIGRLLERRNKHFQTLETAADSIAEGLEALDQVGRAIRHIRSKHLGPEGAADHLISVSLHSRVRRYLGRKLAHVVGLGFEGQRDGTEPAPWTDWEAAWTGDLTLPASAPADGEQTEEKTA